MKAYDLSRGRLRARWRKLRRDPAAFVDDLPWRPLRLVGLGLLTAAMLAEGRFGARSRAQTWAREDVALRWSEGRYALRDGAGEAVAAPEAMLQVQPVGCAVVLCAFSHAGELSGACLIKPQEPAFLAVGATLGGVTGYACESGEMPMRIRVRPVSRVGLYRHALQAGATRAEALRQAWPPAQRRSAEMPRAAYHQWIRRNEPGPMRLRELARRMSGVKDWPRVSVLMPVHDPDPVHLEAAIRSVQRQVAADWQLCIADDGSRSEAVQQLLRNAAEGDRRIRLVRLAVSGGVAAATNAALAEADGEVCLFLDHDDELASHALAAVAAGFADGPDLVALYSDEDTIDAAARRSAPVFKPEFDAERLLAQNYVNHLFAVRTGVLRAVGGLQAELDGAQDHDLVLRVAELGPLRRLPEVLYHWRNYPGGRSLSQRAPGQMLEARLSAVEAALGRRRRTDSVAPTPWGWLDSRPRLPDPPPSIAAIVPTRDGALLAACAAGLLHATDYPRLEMHIVDNGSRDPEVLETLVRLQGDPRVRVHRIDAPFNFSALNNQAVAKTEADLLLFLNDDVLAAEPGWLRRMAAMAVREDVGAVGARLAYPDGRIQHAGLVLGLGPHRVAGHEFRAAPGDAPGPQGRLQVTREVAAVTAACLVVGRRKFAAVGGFDEQLAVAFNDVDLCLKLGAAGYRNLWTPRAQLVHAESASRGADTTSEKRARFDAEVRMMRERWGEILIKDPSYNPNLTLDDESFTPARVSRAPAIWR